MPQYGRACRHHWPIDEHCTFLNHGSFGATPFVVLTSQFRWQQQVETQPVRFMTQDLPQHLAQATQALAHFVGGNPENLVFIDNATTGINTVLRSMAWQPGDRILATSHGYGAVRQALTYLHDRYGVDVIELEIPFPVTDATTLLSKVQEALSAEYRLFVIDHITSPTALIFPIADIIQAAHARSVPVLVDGAHAPGMIPLALDQLQADWYVGNCHKWLCAAKGCAFLYTHPDRQGAIHPLTISHGYKEGYQTEFSWTGTKDFSPWLSITDAIGFLESLNLNELQQRNHALAWQAAQELAKAWNVAFVTPKSLLGSMVTLPLPAFCQTLTGKQLHDRLWEEFQIEVPIVPFDSQLWIRISTHAYNDLPDYQKLAEALVSVGIGT